MKIAVIIPCYNESGSIRPLLEEIRGMQLQNAVLHPVVVNDASTDNTLEMAALEGVVLLDLPVNLGIGGAVQTGFRYAFSNGFDIAIQVDGDGQHDPAYIPELLRELQKGSNVVIGSRFIDRKGFQSTKMRLRGIRIISNMIRLLTGLRIMDPTSGFRAYDKDALEFVQTQYSDDFPEPVSIIQLYRRGFGIAEVPVEMRERAAGISSIGNLTAVFYMVKVCLALVYKRL